MSQHVIPPRVPRTMRDRISKRRPGLLLMVAFATGIQLTPDHAIGAQSGAETAARPRLAVMGDSDSHGYQDRISFPIDGSARGGALRATTLQWTEVLALLRGATIDLGARDTVGVHARLARAASLAGWSLRTPRKHDHVHNFAVSGAVCADLNGGRYRQSEHLARSITSEPHAWRHGVVVIRIGVNSFGMKDELDKLAEDARHPQVLANMHDCTRAVREALQRLTQLEPTLRFVLVGIFNNAHWPPYFAHWRDPQALQNIDQGLDTFDQSLRAIAGADPRIAFFDERRHFADHFGKRGPSGEPAYRVLEWRAGRRLANTIGDDPSNAMLADGHTGTVWNAFWVNHLLALMQQRFGMTVTPLSTDEIEALLQREGRE